ncbi:MAG: protein-L-isoaspartate(D-aspartate) O-methyltransferase [Bacteroidales bacterium]|nr:protein-L-isoaspartate O-methyltransferase [Bacteroidota bacterium]MBQ9508080.1 protein-L-isoaspartate(D-aspartate) O-methyltransferase [Bacteroidales bacterium]MBR6062773.1 protein-L-isoaspartate(D-aspartate) O-methyltransferase [Bacteroidales bacterium]
MDYMLLGAKKKLINTLREKGINDEQVLAAFDKVDRHLFIDSFLWPKAYEDTALHIYCDQTISQPSTVAFQTMLLQLKPGEKVLEIGTGSGFQAAILGAMGARVFTVERHLELFSKAKDLLSKINDRIILRFGDGFQGFEKYAPYDKVIVTCGAPEIPEALLRQLKPGGIMVIPVGTEGQVMKRITKIDDNNYQEEEFGNFNFVPMLEARVVNRDKEI